MTPTTWRDHPLFSAIFLKPFSSSLRAFLFSRFIGVALAIFVVVLGTATILYDRLIVHQAQETAAGIAAQTYTTINALMPHGPSRDELQGVIEEIKAAHAGSPFRIELYRSPLVNEIYGPVERETLFSEKIRTLPPGHGRQLTLENHTWTRHIYAPDRGGSLLPHLPR